jgi:hypothetical protein
VLKHTSSASALLFFKVYQVLSLSHGMVMTLVMLKHTAKPKSLNEIFIRFSPGMLETDSARSITKVSELNNGEPCLIVWQHPAIVFIAAAR